MTTPVRPHARYADSWIETVEDFGDPERMAGSGAWLVPSVEATAAGCAAFAAAVLAAEAADGDDARVRSTCYWIAAGDEATPGPVIGFLHLRHELNDWLRTVGGHIGYSIRPARRGEGHATRALALGLRAAHGLGIDRVLVTCDIDNDASRRTILGNGGVLEDTRNGKLRFWIEAAPRHW